MTLTREACCRPVTPMFCSMHTFIKPSSQRLENECHSLSACHALAWSLHTTCQFKNKPAGVVSAERLTQFDFMSNMRWVHHIPSCFSKMFWRRLQTFFITLPYRAWSSDADFLIVVTCGEISVEKLSITAVTSDWLIYHSVFVSLLSFISLIIRSKDSCLLGDMK